MMDDRTQYVVSRRVCRAAFDHEDKPMIEAQQRRAVRGSSRAASVLLQIDAASVRGGAGFSRKMIKAEASTAVLCLTVESIHVRAVPGNLRWNLSINLALQGGAMGEMDAANAAHRAAASESEEGNGGIL